MSTTKFFQPQTKTSGNGTERRAVVEDLRKTFRFTLEGIYNRKVCHKDHGYKMRTFTLDGKTRKVWVFKKNIHEYDPYGQDAIDHRVRKGIQKEDWWFELHPDDEIYYKGVPHCDPTDPEKKQWIVRQTWIKFCGKIPMMLDDGLKYMYIRLPTTTHELAVIKVPKTNCGMNITEMRASAIHNPFDGPADPILADLRTMRIDLNESIAMEAMKPERVASRYERYGDDWDLAA